MNKVEDLVKILTEYKLKDEEEMKRLKNNINSKYELALMDFRTIDNYDDVVETLDEVIIKLQDLQERIIERNERKLF